MKIHDDDDDDDDEQLQTTTYQYQPKASPERSRISSCRKGAVDNFMRVVKCKEDLTCVEVRWFVSKKNDNRRKIFADMLLHMSPIDRIFWFFAVDGCGAYLIIFRDPGMKRHHLSVRHPTCFPRGGCCCISCEWPSYVVVSNFFFGYPPNINIVTTTSLHIFSSQVELRFRWFELDQKTRKAKRDQDLAITSREKILFWEELWCGPEFLHRMLSPPSFLSSVAGRSLTYWPIHHRRHRFYRNEEHIPYRSIHKG